MLLRRRSLVLPSTRSAVQGFTWRCDTLLEKYRGGIRDVQNGLLTPYKSIEIPGNVVLYGGVDLLWMGVKKLLSTNAAITANEYLDNAHAAIAVGDSVTAAVSSQTDLQASSGVTHRYWQGMDATFPTHTTGATLSTSSKILYKVTISTANANFAWQEWAVGNAVGSSKSKKPYPGRLLNRKVASLGTKTSAGTWALTVTLSIA